MSVFCLFSFFNARLWSQSESVLSRPAEGPTTPRGSALARLLEEAKLELQALNESDGSQSSEEEGEGAETVGVQKEEVCVSETQDGEGAHDANMSAMEEWYQSWYEPEPIDDSLANSFLTASLRTTVCKNDAFRTILCFELNFKIQN